MCPFHPLPAGEPFRPLLAGAPFRVLRLAGKRFVQERREAGRWVGGKGAMNSVRRVLFGLPQVLAADEVVFVEGEKDSINLAAAGAGRYLGLGTWWERQSIVAQHPILK